MSAKMVQMELFHHDKIELLTFNLNQLTDASERKFRGLFARYNELERQFIEMEKRYDRMLLSEVK